MSIMPIPSTTPVFCFGLLTVLGLCGCSLTTHSFSLTAPLHHRTFRSLENGVLAPTPHQASTPSLVPLAMTQGDDADEEDDEEEEPLSQGVNSVSWLPTVVNAPKVEETDASTAAVDILPLFPLGGIVYTPNSEHVLNIFEPRYRKMYTDILMNGSKRFVVSMSHPDEQGRFAQTGVLFELLELKEVSEQTKDQIKYICSHKVTGRVKLHRILNPEAWESRETYLRVEGTILSDDNEADGGKNNTSSSANNTGNDVYGAVVAALGVGGGRKEEKALRSAFSQLVELQHDMEEDVRFTRASVLSLAVKPGAGEDGLWQTVRLWQSFADQRLMARQNELQRDFQEKLQAFLKKEKGLKEDELPSDLSPELREEVKELQKRMTVELTPLVLESTLTMQKILEAADHKARLTLLRHFVLAETRRLTTKRTLKGMFSSSSSYTKSTSDDEDTTTAEKKSTENNEEKPEDTTIEDLKRQVEDSTSDSKGSSMFDDPDAFQ